jgi:hypothetical protein
MTNTLPFWLEDEGLNAADGIAWPFFVGNEEDINITITMVVPSIHAILALLRELL